MPTLAYFIERTEQKIRFSRLHLDEIRNHSTQNAGTDFERAHYESILFHMYGAIDAFLQELNIYYACELPISKVSRRALAKNLAKRALVSSELLEIEALQSPANDSLGTFSEFRHHATHRGGLSMKHYFNGPSNLVHPTTREEIKTDTIDLFSEWLDRLTVLLKTFRTTARKSDE